MKNQQDLLNGNNIEKIFELLWEQYKLLQQHYWKSLAQYSVAIITLWAIPYSYPKIVSMIGTFVFFFPSIACFLSIVSTWHLGAEYQRLRVVKEQFNDLQKREYNIVFSFPSKYWWERLFGRRIGTTITFIFLCGFLGVSIIDFFMISELLKHIQ